MNDVLGFVIAACFCVATYGALAYFLGRMLVRSSRRGAGPILAYAVALIVLWPPCFWVAIKIAVNVIPVGLGHGGSLFILPYMVVSIVVFIASLILYIPRMTSATSPERPK